MLLEHQDVILKFRSPSWWKELSKETSSKIDEVFSIWKAFGGNTRDKNPIRTLGNYSKPSNKGYRNTIELPVWNNVVPLRFDTIRLVQNGCSFHILLSEDPNQHLKDFLKLVDSIDLDDENRERAHLRSIPTREDLTTRFLAQFFPPGRTAKLRNDILMFQQHHGESLSEAWTRFKDLLQKVPHHGIDRWLQIQIFYDHVSFHLKCEIDRAAGGKLRNKNADESWEIIENLALYDHEGWNDTKEFVKPVKAISTPQGISKTPDRRLLELEDQINFLLKGLRPTLRSSTHIPHAYADAPSTPSIRNYMAAHTKRMERFENSIFKQREEINGKITKMFGFLKELTTNRAPEKVLIREEAKFSVTKNVNSISLARGEEERSDKTDETLDNTIKPIITETKIPVMEAERSNETKNKPIKKAERKEVEEVLSSRPMPAETDIRHSLASHSYIYPLGIFEDVLVKVVEHAYPVDFVILDIKENENRPFILGTPFLTTAKATIKFDKGTITLRFGKKLLPKKRICSPSSSSNPSRNQTCDLISPSSSVYTPTPPQIFEIGKCSTKMYLKHHEEQVEDILNYLEELSFHRIEKIEEGRINRMITQRNSNELKIKLERVRSQVIKLQRKKLGQKDKIAFAHYRISDLERIIKKIQARHQTDQEDL
ncbi:zinc finger, CCHC-type containing protein [Tanacetum coccineum]